MTISLYAQSLGVREQLPGFSELLVYVLEQFVIGFN